MNIDTLQIYNELKASGINEEQAQAQAKAIANANRVTPEDLAKVREDFSNNLVKVREDFSNTIDKLILKIDINFNYMAKIGGAIFGALIINIILSWFK